MSGGYLSGEELNASDMPGVPLTPTSQTANGTPTSGTTETMDVVLGTYVFTTPGAHRFEARMNGLIGNGSVTSDAYAIRIRDGGASTPTSASTLIAEQVWHCTNAGTGGRGPIPLAGTFTPSAGTHTLGVFAVRLQGTGIFTPLCPNGDIAGVLGRELFVVDLGLA